MRKLRFSKKQIISLALVCIILYLPVRFCLKELGDRHTFETDQGDLVTITINNLAQSQLVSVSTDGEQTYLVFPEHTFDSSKEIAKHYFVFSHDKDGVHYYAILDQTVRVYTKNAPFVLAEDGYCYQIQFIRDYDVKDNKDLGWCVFLACYENEDGKPGKYIGSFRCVGLVGKPMITEREMLDSVGTVVHTRRELEQRLNGKFASSQTELLPEYTEDGEQDMKTLKNIESLLAAHGLSGYFEKMKGAVKNSIHIKVESDDDASIAIGASKMGGLPDLPKGVDWFRQKMTDIPLSFICQINFAEVKPYDTADRLPASGILYFFYNCSMDGMPWGFDPKDADGKVVYYYDGDLSELERREAPEDIEENSCVFGAAKLRFDTAIDLPDLESPAGEALALAEDDREKYWELMDEVSGSLVNKLLGHSNNIQGGMELECEFVTNGLYCGNSSGYKEGRALGLDKNTGHWNLLLQVDSNEDIGMMWGDCGRLYLWITDEDLASKNFEASWLILQCG